MVAPVPYTAHEHSPCQICGKHFEEEDIVLGHSVRAAVVELIREAHPDWDEDGFICQKDLNQFRNLYTQKLVEEDRGQITELEEEVLASLEDEEFLSKNLNEEYEEKLTFGQELADKIAAFGGSWKFIISFGGILVGWILINTVVLSKGQQFDEYPFILLNLVLSCLAALQAPVIMMSQNRQEAKDRLRSEQEYKINLKAELEIRHLMSKLDQLRQHQWRRLLEIQHIQLDLMNEMTERKRPAASTPPAPSVFETASRLADQTIAENLISAPSNK
ncbi:MAG: DUF1003 domain-containing protein [Verrucomicrobia bacterium]|nr:DUF1003 domain-containing protein [Verrucomicrobiota bacterium]